nr:hypothetical protein [Clostridia bacterium]
MCEEIGKEIFQRVFDGIKRHWHDYAEWKDLKGQIEQAWKKVFETDVYHADRFAEIDYEGLTSYLIGNGYDKVYDIAVYTGDIGRSKESLLAASYCYAKANHAAGRRTVEKIVELAIKITKAFFIAKLSPGMLALAAESRGQHEDITDRLDLIIGLLRI